MRCLHELVGGMARSIGMYATAGAIALTGCGAGQETPASVPQIQSVDDLAEPTSATYSSIMYRRTGFLDFDVDAAEFLGGREHEEYGTRFMTGYFKDSGTTFSLTIARGCKSRIVRTMQGESFGIYLDREGDGVYEFRFPKDTDHLFLLHILKNHDEQERLKQKRREDRRWRGAFRPYAAL